MADETLFPDDQNPPSPQDANSNNPPPADELPGAPG